MVYPPPSKCRAPFPGAPAALSRPTLLAALLAAGCASQGEDVRPVSPTPPPPASSTELNMGYDTAVRLGGAYLATRGYQVELVMAKMREGAWWLSYAAHQGAPQLDLRVDPRTGDVQLQKGPPETATTPAAPR
ncbi:hypothetical protein FGE12_25065 [Aggregicoccus sp. 17bor-14]|uniref:hypothetical protein n=1 Tax=Myxococcaceae TaxID=31 RepID=UPI00129CD2C7|nr:MULTISPECIES: hypothetical protein [Myxococcaceae]MBF5045702.1 hypothetical protein [Simulacricoccus sp. 17bor-14]MRI91438.1 hypothetical protein [Aggregicoccus sp. 17bor-14]